MEIEGFEEKPTISSNINAGVYAFNPQVLNYIPNKKFMNMPSLFENLKTKESSLFAYPMHEDWLDIGRISDLQKLINEKYLKMKKSESNSITNLIYKELIELNLINVDKVIKISDKTRDKNIPVYIDEESKIIFLEKYETTTDYYEENVSGNPKDVNFLNNGYYLDDKRRYEQFKEIIHQSKHVLDFGCEWGGFLKQIECNSSKISGIELNEQCIAYLQKTMPHGKFNKDVNQVEGNPDLITSFHVLEHIPNQCETLRSLHNLLAYNGTLIIEVPHANDFLIQSINLPEFKQFTFLERTSDFAYKIIIRKVLSKAGFENSNTLSTVWIFKSYGLDVGS